jgi:MFS family permease
MLARGSARAGQGSYEAFAVAAVLSAALSVFSLTLPNTPPLMRKSRRASRRFAEWLELVREPSVVLLLLLALGVSTTTPFVYQVVPAYLLNLGLARPWIATAMSLGQVPEIVLLLVLPRILGLFGFRGTLGLGITAWVAYHGVMGSNLALALALVGVPLQGLGIALFSITGPIYLDSQVPSDRRASGQALYITATAGIGNLLGSLLAGEIVSRVGFVSAPVFLTPLIINLALLSIFIIAFRPRPREETPGLRQLAANADQIQESFDSTSPT